jgi:4-amino-4-deoxy-L-arabinose transferase-like glycosyltransferase
MKHLIQYSRAQLRRAAERLGAAGGRAFGLPRLTERRAILVVAGASLSIHAIALASLPLIITPDGGMYITSAIGIQAGGQPWVSPDLTPGYPAILAAVFSIFGRGGAGILLLNHVLAWGTCAFVAAAAVRVGGPFWGMVAGLAFALEPWSLTLSSYALTETPGTAFVAAAGAMAICWHRGRLAETLALGVLLACACMMRPAVQVLVPFLAASWAIRVPATTKRRWLLGAAVVGAFVATSSPWLIYNSTRGVYGFARGAGWVLWYGVGFNGFLDQAFPVDERTRRSFRVSVGNPPKDHEFMRVVEDTGARQDPAQARLLSAWALASIRKRPGAYVESGFYTLLWQLNYGISGKPPMYDEMPFFVLRLFEDGTRTIGAVAPNFQGAGPFPHWQNFSMDWRGGILQPYLVWWGEGHVRGWPQVPLFLAAVAAVWKALWRKDAGLALFFLGPLVFVAAHCALLTPQTRYAMPAWTLWYVAAAWVLRGGGDRMMGIIGSAVARDRLTN